MTPSSYQYSRTMNQWHAVNRQMKREWFRTEADAKAFAESGNPMTEYKGYFINDRFQIFDDKGKEWFTASWQRGVSILDAMMTIDVSDVARNACAKHHPVEILAVMDDVEIENGYYEIEDESRKADERGEMELLND